MSESKFDWKVYHQSVVTSKELRKMMSIILDSGQGYLSSIIAGIKLIACLIFLICIKRLIDHEKMVGRQALEQHLENQEDDDNEIND